MNSSMTFSIMCLELGIAKGTSYLSLAILSLQINLEIVFTGLTTRNDAQTYLYREDFYSNDTRGVSVSLTLCSTSINACSVVFFLFFNHKTLTQ